MSHDQEPKPTEGTGIAGQEIHRRALLAIASKGFAVLSVGASAQALQVPWKTKGDGYRCGGYVLGNLTADISCGVNGAEDSSCGNSVTQGNASGGPVGVDHACGQEFDADCGESGGTYAHSDSNCAPSGFDLACGLPGSPIGNPIPDSGG